MKAVIKRINKIITSKFKKNASVNKNISLDKMLNILQDDNRFYIHINSTNINITYNHGYYIHDPYGGIKYMNTSDIYFFLDLYSSDCTLKLRLGEQ
jgi:hypothetical protein